jgi:hypothetical protein
MRRALNIDEQSYGENHPSVAIRLNDLALLLKDTNRLTDAESLIAAPSRSPRPVWVMNTPMLPITVR